MRLGTYNVLGLTGYPPHLADEAGKVTHFGGVFAELRCDVLALQEGPALATARRIAERLDMHIAAFASPTAYPGCVFSRYPIRESRTFSHPGPGGREGPFSRHAGAVRLDVGGRDLWVVDVHLHPRDVALRASEAGVLAARIEGLSPTVVLGDFNSRVGEPVHEMLSGRGFINAMAAAGGGIVPTMDTAGVRPAPIDHIYLSAELGGLLASARVVREPGFRLEPPAPEGAWAHSDHLPVVADVRY